MKRLATVITVVAASMLFSAITILADEYSGTNESYGEGVQSTQKNECLLVAKNCATDFSTVQQRAMDLRKEIAKGLDVYTPAELKRLKDQLDWIEYDSDNPGIF